MDLVAGVRKEGSRYVMLPDLTANAHLTFPFPPSGGRAEFKWEDVKSDQHRENYLGHSLMARTSSSRPRPLTSDPPNTPSRNAQYLAARSLVTNSNRNPHSCGPLAKEPRSLLVRHLLNRVRKRNRRTTARDRNPAHQRSGTRRPERGAGIRRHAASAWDRNVGSREERGGEGCEGDG